MVANANITLPLIVLVGETATGKSKAAIQLAERMNGEIIAADSRTVYIGMDIGTAKPSVTDRARVPHHLIDIRTPNQIFTVADFQLLANGAITDIHQRNKLPIIVGGTGLYIDALIYNYQLNKNRLTDKERSQLGQRSIEELQQLLQENAIVIPVNKTNKRHLIRQFERKGQLSQNESLRDNTLILGIKSDKATREERLRNRVDRMLALGLEKEVLGLVQKYGWEINPMRTIGYQEFRQFINHELTLGQTRDFIVQNSLHFAKRQATWFKRNKAIQWVEEQGRLVDLVTTFLNK